MGKRGELKPHASWKGERTRVGLDSEERVKMRKIEIGWRFEKWK